MLTIHLPEDLERYVQGEVQSGRFVSADDAIIEAIRLLQQKEQEEQSRRKPLTPDELNRQLLAAGLLSQIPSRPDPASYQEFSPIVIQGEPLSETISSQAPLRWQILTSWTAAPSSNATSRCPARAGLQSLAPSPSWESDLSRPHHCRRSLCRNRPSPPGRSHLPSGCGRFACSFPDRSGSGIPCPRDHHFPPGRRYEAGRCPRTAGL